ncbi:MAG: hypothetical protein JRJ02_07870 [Deltaproteobacteria bacterium]|nr:hypothetical protein [Deltaproteobacteria bacterium]MBW1862276.1 hypothetical protein [Deltaproteobacteria bacterium]
MSERKYLNFVVVTGIFLLTLAFIGNSFAQSETKSSGVKKKMTASQIAFIVKFDKNEDGKLDKAEFTGSHFPVYDKNSDGFIEVTEAPEGATAY